MQGPGSEVCYDRHPACSACQASHLEAGTRGRRTRPGCPLHSLATGHNSSAYTPRPGRRAPWEHRPFVGDSAATSCLEEPEDRKGGIRWVNWQEAGRGYCGGRRAGPAPPLALRIPAQEAEGPRAAGLIHRHVVRLALPLGVQARPGVGGHCPHRSSWVLLQVGRAFLACLLSDQ